MSAFIAYEAGNEQGYKAGKEAGYKEGYDEGRIMGGAEVYDLAYELGVLHGRIQILSGM